MSNVDLRESRINFIINLGGYVTKEFEKHWFRSQICHMCTPGTNKMCLHFFFQHDLYQVQNMKIDNTHNFV